MHELSMNQIAYINREKRKKKLITASRILILIVFFLLWEVCADTGLIDSFIFSSPSRLLDCFFTMLKNQNLLFHIGITLFETMLSFVLVIFFTLFVTILLWQSKTASKILEPYLVVLNSLPKSALAPLLIVWLGANYKTIILTGMSVAIFGSILSLYTGFIHTDPEKIKLVRTLGGNRVHILFKVVLPYNIPALFSILKVNIGLCLVGVIIGEFIAARCGLGYLIIYGSQVFKLDWVILSTLILCLIAMALYSAIGGLEKFYLKKR